MDGKSTNVVVVIVSRKEDRKPENNFVQRLTERREKGGVGRDMINREDVCTGENIGTREGAKRTAGSNLETGHDRSMAGNMVEVGFSKSRAK